MALRTSKQVLAELDRSAGRSLGSAAQDYDRKTLSALRGVIRTAKSRDGALRALNAALLRRMETAPLEQALEETFVTASRVGAVSATPPGREKRKRSRA